MCYCVDFAALYWTAYEALKRAGTKSPEEDPHPVYSFVSGALAGTVSMISLTDSVLQNELAFHAKIFPH